MRRKSPLLAIPVAKKNVKPLPKSAPSSRRKERPMPAASSNDMAPAVCTAFAHGADDVYRASADTLIYALSSLESAALNADDPAVAAETWLFVLQTTAEVRRRVAALKAPVRRQPARRKSQPKKKEAADAR